MPTLAPIAVSPRHAAAETAPLARPATVPGGYDIIAPAGQGTFCDIWHARDRHTGEPCVLKCLRTEWQDHRAARKLLENEAEIGRSVSSPHVVRVIDAFLKVPPRCVVLEW